MSHHIYTTKGFILGSNPYGESGKFINIFTHDLGLISATASGIRVSKSKLRYHLQDYDFSNISFVKGKEMWRITGARSIDQDTIYSKQAKVVYIKILNLLKRFLHGEEKNENLFYIVESLFKYLCLQEIKDEEIIDIESLAVLRILNNLGYIRSNDKIEGLLNNINIDSDIIKAVNNNRKEIIQEINKALKVSQM